MLNVEYCRRNASVAKSSKLFASCNSCSPSQSAYFSASSARSWSLSRSSRRKIVSGGECAEFGGRELMLLQFGEQRAEFLRETGAAGAAAKQFQFVRVPQQQGAQHHHPAFVGQQFRRRDVEFFKNEPREPVEGKNFQAREAGNRIVRRATGVRAGRWPVWARAGSAAGLRGFPRSAARISARQRNVLPLPAGPRRKRACTADFSRKDAKAQRNLFVNKWPYFLFPFGELGL